MVFPVFGQVTVLDAARSQYNKNDFSTSALLYEQDIRNGNNSASVYYNLGNAYFRAKNAPAAIWCYERALKLAPNDGASEHNLSLAQKMLEQPIPQLALPFWQRAKQEWSYALPAIIWAIISLIGLWLAAYLLFQLWQKGKPLHRKLLYRAIAAIAVGIVATYLGYARYKADTTPQFAIVLNNTELHALPASEAAIITDVGKGNKVALQLLMEDWAKVRLPDGEEGWLWRKAMAEI